MQTQEISTPKEFYRKERDRFYTEWKSSFWRELFQNSVDAGAKNISIDISTVRRRASFFSGGESANDVIRVVFRDDGCGMTGDVIDNVYFRPGNSTKTDGNSVGGYGRARLMTNFSQFRYGIVTGDRAVEGDGPRYVHKTVAEMLDLLADARTNLLGRTGEEGVDFCLSEIDREIAQLGSLSDGRGIKGCRMEIDIDPEDGSYWNKPTVDGMTDYLVHYLKTSNVPAAVTINGELSTNRLSTRGMRKMVLSAPGSDGAEDAPFADAYHTKNASAPFLRKLLVRVDGATMIEEDIDVDLQVVLEVAKNKSRDVLTSNRDGFRRGFKQAVDEFKQKLILDVRTATDDREDARRSVTGELGRNTARPADLSDSIAKLPPMPEGVPKAVPVARDEFAMSRIESRGYGGIPYDYLEKFFRQASWSRYDTFLGSDWDSPWVRTADTLRDATYGKSGADLISTGLKTLDDETRGVVLAYLHAELEKDRRTKLEQSLERLKGLNDVVIHTKGAIKGPVKRAVAKYDPANWSEEHGKGRREKELLSAWMILCDIAIQHLGEKHPNTIPSGGIQWTTGWIFNAPESHYRVGQSHESFMIEALCAKDGSKVDLLLNPVDSDGRPAYDLNDPSDVQRLAMIACHEVAHIHTSSHNEDFANVLTDLACMFDHREGHRRISLARKEIRRAFKEGRVKIQAMDDEVGSRPSFRLMAAVNPVAAMAAGSQRCGPDGSALGTAAAMFDGAVRDAGDGTWDVDLGTISAAEEALRTGFAAEPEMERERSFGM